jgi:D-alanine-D-alanine ligase-like ATP-grasp enzyme
MAYVPHDHEYRIHVFLGKSIRISEKKFSEGNKYTTIKPTCDRETRKLLRTAAKQAVSAVGLDFGCVDALWGKDGKAYVLEVNAAPGLGGTLPKLYAEVFEQWSGGEWEDAE